MIQSISHITFIVKDVKRSAELFRFVFDAAEVYDSSDKDYSVGYEKFFLIGGTWIAIMEGNSISERSYDHIAFQVSESDFDSYLARVKKSGLEILEGRGRIGGEARSVYFYDYDNHLFELHTGTLSERLSSYRKNALR
jgi:catechol 2,3-dioxygenase-like lactoylglutathione lyase family enzyme